MKKTTVKQVVWVLSVPSIAKPKKREFLYYTGGDWGPDVLPTEDVLDAIRFDSSAEALSSDAARGWGSSVGGVRAHRVELTTTARYEP